ncbi:hypothetical protein MPC1_80013 [Methylocella tundrae]|nr:hypothetical protein MPC1_80013 [Methylocella tundrae]
MEFIQCIDSIQIDYPSIVWFRAVRAFHSGGRLQAERAPWVFQKSYLDKFHTVSILNCMYFIHNVRSTASIRHFGSTWM